MMKWTAFAVVLAVTGSARAQPTASLTTMPHEPPVVSGSAEQYVLQQAAIEARDPSDPGRPSAMLELAEAHRVLARRDEETRVLARIMLDHPAFQADRVLFRLAMALVAQNRPEQARQVWLRLIRHHPASPYVQAGYVSLADGDAAEGDLTAARQFLERALTLPKHPWEAYARYRYAWVIAQQGDRAAARAELDHAARAASRPGQVGAAEVSAAIARDRPVLLR